VRGGGFLIFFLPSLIKLSFHNLIENDSLEIGKNDSLEIGKI
jgi:hypothetical protein